MLSCMLTKSSCILLKKCYNANEVISMNAEELRRLERSNRGLPMDATDEEVRAYDAEKLRRR